MCELRSRNYECRMFNKLIGDWLIRGIERSRNYEFSVKIFP